MRGMGDMYKQIQAFQAKMKKMQEELATREVSASAGGDMVRVTVNGQHETVSVKIAKEVVDPNDVEMLEDLIMAATNEAQRRATEMVQEEMSKLTGGLSIPGLF